MYVCIIFLTEHLKLSFSLSNTLIYITLIYLNIHHCVTTVYHYHI